MKFFSSKRRPRDINKWRNCQIWIWSRYGDPYFCKNTPTIVTQKKKIDKGETISLYCCLLACVWLILKHITKKTLTSVGTSVLWFKITFSGRLYLRNKQQFKKVTKIWGWLVTWSNFVNPARLLGWFDHVPTKFLTLLCITYSYICKRHIIQGCVLQRTLDLRPNLDYSLIYSYRLEKFIIGIEIFVYKWFMSTMFCKDHFYETINIYVFV